MFMLLKAICTFNAIPIKIPMTYFTELKQIISKIYMEPEKVLHSNSDPEEEDKVGGITLPNIKLYYKTIEIKTAWDWHENRHIDQCNKPSNKPTPLQSINIWQRKQAHAMIIYTINRAGKIG